MRPEGFPEIKPHAEFDTDEARLDVLSRMRAADRAFGNELLEAPGVLRHAEDNETTLDLWLKSTDLDPRTRLAQTKGPFVELAGPSHGRYHLVDTSQLPRTLFTSNKDIGTLDDYGRLSKPVIRADGREMPVRDEGAGAVFARAFGGFLQDHHGEQLTDEEIAEVMGQTTASRGQALEEAWRLTEPGGILVWEAGARTDISYARQLGFQPLMLAREHFLVIKGPLLAKAAAHPNVDWKAENWSAVMEKPIAPPQETTAEGE